MKRLVLIIFCAILSIAGIAQNTRVIKGMVMSTDEEPLGGVTIQVLGSSSSTSSSRDGKFEIKAPSHAKELEASKDGYFSAKAEIDGTYVIFKLKFDKKRAKSKAAESNARRDEELEARLLALETAKVGANVNIGTASEEELEEKLRAELEAKIRAEIEEEARMKAEIEAQIRAEMEAEAKAKAEAEARAKVEAEIRARLEAEALAQAEAEAKAKAEAEALAQAEAEAKAKAEAEALAQAEAEAKAKAEAEALAQAEAEAKAKAEAEALAQAEAEAKAKAEAEALALAEAEAKAKAEAEALALAEAEAKAKAEAEALALAEAEAKAKAEAEALALAEAEAKAKAEAEALAQAEAEAKAKAEAEALALTETGTETPVIAEAKQAQNFEETVDLGLPSGLKWASCNIGASSPEECGNYFAWGEIDPKSNYSDFNSITRQKKMKQINGDANYDVATAKLGKSWHVPTLADFEELIKNCTWEWTTVNGVNGYKVTGPNGNSIFLPSTGYRDGAVCNNDGKMGEYWSSTPHKDTEYSYYLCYSGDSYYTFWNCRYVGRCVRPVKK